MSELTWVVGDQDPPLRLTLYNYEGTVVDLTGSTAVLKLAGPDGVLKVSSAMAVVTPATGGVVDYSWTTTDLNAVNPYDGEVEVTKAGRKRTFRGFRVNVVATIG